MKSIVLVLLLFLSAMGFSQELTYKSNGNIVNAQNERVSPAEMRKLLENKLGLLNFYNAGRSKKTVGNVLLIAGAGFVAGDLMLGLYSDTEYPTALTYIGVASMLIAIPVKIGYSKKIRTVVTDYNKQLTDNTSRFSIDKLSICANRNGVGLQLTF